MPVSELYREHGMSCASFYKWHEKCGGVDAMMIKQMKAMDVGNRILVKIFVELSMLNELLKVALRKNRLAIPMSGDSR